MKQTDAKHTETPWTVCHTARHEKHGQSAIYAEPNGRGVTIVYDGVADAEFIVRAVNSHDDLLELIERALPYIETTAELIRPCRPDASNWIAAAKTAIARATGKS